MKKTVKKASKKRPPRAKKQFKDLATVKSYFEGYRRGVTDLNNRLVAGEGLDDAIDKIMSDLK